MDQLQVGHLLHPQGLEYCFHDLVLPGGKAGRGGDGGSREGEHFETAQAAAVRESPAAAQGKRFVGKQLQASLWARVALAAGRLVLPGPALE